MAVTDRILKMKLAAVCTHNNNSGQTTLKIIQAEKKFQSALFKKMGFG
jgi:hypothetical protein